MKKGDLTGIFTSALAIISAFISLFFHLPTLLNDPSKQDMFFTLIPIGLVVLGARLLWIDVRVRRQPSSRTETEDSRKNAETASR